ncbi:MAG TPA: hypothetical protein VK509_17410 [Polyangiales bacterium]|nr:hypothetical protein [Polyangiales bacterium]
MGSAVRCRTAVLLALSIAIVALLGCSDLKVIASERSDSGIEGGDDPAADGGAQGGSGGSGAGVAGPRPQPGAAGSQAQGSGGNGTSASAGSAAGANGGGAGGSGSGDAGGSNAGSAGDNAGSGNACPPSVEGCPCPAGSCGSELACVDGKCTSVFCGNGEVDGAEQCDDGNAVDTDACTHECLDARCGDGLLRSDTSSEECDDGNGADGDSCSNACEKHYNVAFVTSTTYSIAMLGNVAGADAACKARASAGGLSGNFIAWITSMQAPLATRLGSARGWVRPDGKPFLDEADGRATYYPPRITELDVELTSASPPALGSHAGSETGDCDEWTSSSGTKSFLSGDPTGGAGAWNGSLSGQACSANFRLYCLQKDFTNTLTFERASGRLAFVSNEPWTPSGGLAGADARCNQDAQAAGLVGSFKAMLSTTSAGAASRFSTGGGPWVRRDGIPLVAKAADMFAASGMLLAPLQLTASGDYLTNYGGWSGSANPQQAGTNTCSDWTSAAMSAHGTAGRVLFARIPDMLAFDPNLGCDAGFTHLYCLQTP